MRKSRSAILTLIAGAAVTGTALAASAPITGDLLRAGEATGFTPSGKVVVNATIAAFVGKEAAAEAQSDTKRLKSEGFVRYVVQLDRSVAGRPAAQGLSSVIELGSPAGARKEQQAQLSRDIKEQGTAPVRHFTVPGVPGSTGIVATGARAGVPDGAANAVWVEGTCVLAVADFLETSASASGPVIAGVEAIYKRTKGHCGAPVAASSASPQTRVPAGGALSAAAVILRARRVEI